MSERAKGQAIAVGVGILLAALCAAAGQGCGTVAGVGRDLTAWAEGGAMDAGDNARAIRAR